MRHATIFFAVLAGMFLLGCEKEPENQEGQTTSDVPFTSVTFTIGDETVEGVVSDDRTITIQFENVEDFTKASMTIELNPGYTLTYPTDLDNVNLAEAPVLNFRAPDNSIIKYNLVIRSYALVIADAAKIQVNSLEPGVGVTFDNAAKQIVITFDKSQMVPEDITLTFNEGALQSDATVQDTAFDFSKGLEQPLIFTIGDQQREYSVRLDVSNVIPYTPRSIGFTDETSQWVNTEEYPYIEVYRTSAPGIPVPLFCLNNCWMGENPHDWDTSCYIDADGDGVAESPDYEYTNAHDGFSFMGDWEEGRPTMMCTGEFLIVTFDQNKVTGSIVSDAGMTLDVNDMTSLISVSGARTQTEQSKIDQSQRTIYVDGSYIYQELNVSEDETNGQPEYRGALGFDADGRICFTTMIPTDPPTQIPLNLTQEKPDLSVATPWEIEDAVTSMPFAYRDGYALSFRDVFHNDFFDGWYEAFGYGWNSFYNARAVIGRTYDNKIGIALTGPGAEAYDNQPEGYDCRPIGYSYPQICYILSQLGWRDVFPIYFNSGTSGTLANNIKLNGQLLMTYDDPAALTTKSSYCICFDPIE